MKIFARACLRGAITNIYEYMKKIMKHEQGKETGEGQLLKVLKFQRDLILGGLKAQHDVNGVDAVSMALQLQEQNNKHPGQFLSTFNEKVHHDTMMRYLAKEKKILSEHNILEKTELLPLKLSDENQAIFDRKKHFDLKEYEQIIVNHALEKKKQVRESGIVFDMKLVSNVKLDVNERKLKQSIKFVREG